MDSRISLASGCDTLNNTTHEAQYNAQMLPTTMKEETVQCIEKKEINCDNHMCGYKALKPLNSVNYYDGQFFVSTEVKEEFPEDGCPQSSPAALCTNKSTIDSNTVFVNEELSKVLEAREIKQEVTEEAFSFIKTEEIHDKKDKFIATTEISEEHRVLGNAGATSVLYEVRTTHQKIQPIMCSEILKNGFNSLTHNNEHIKIEPPTLVGDEGMELHKCQYCDEYFHYDNMLAHVADVHSHKHHKSELYSESINKIHAGSKVDELNYECDSCKRIYKSKSALVLHFKNIHLSCGSIFKCWCGKQFPTQIHLRQHKNKQHGANSKSRNNAVFKKEFQCDTCKKTFKRKYILKIHITNIHYDYGKTFNCWCGNQFRTPNHLHRHKKNQHDANSKGRINAAFEKEFQCDICKKTFKRKSILTRHITSIHYDYGKTFNCWCGKQFRTPNYLYEHKNRQHGANVNSADNTTINTELQCDVCKKTFKRKGGLKTHILDIHYNYGKTFNCWCGKQFRTPKYLHRHKNDQHYANSKGRNNAVFKKEFQCDVCKKTFKRKGGLKTHILDIHYNYGKTFNCWCGKQFRTSKYLYRHKNDQHDANSNGRNNAAFEKEFQCDICKKTFKTNFILTRHITSIHYDYGKTFNCWCGKQFRTPKYLYRHKNRQHGANVNSANNTTIKTELQCDVCKKTFKRKSCLKTHILDMHYNYGKTFNCWCGKEFRTPNYLHRHKKNQHDTNSKGRNNTAFEKEFQCDICKKTFKRKPLLTRHITSIHYDYGKTFKCWCGKQFRAPKYLNQHKNRQHGVNTKITHNK